jgi:hypothetical protein
MNYGCAPRRGKGWRGCIDDDVDAPPATPVAGIAKTQIHFAVAKTPEGPMLFYRWLSPADRRPSHWSAVALEDMPVVLPVLGKAGWTLTLAHVPPPTEGMAYRWETAGGRAHGGMIRAETMMASTPASPFVLYVPGVG